MALGLYPNPAFPTDCTNPTLPNVQSADCVSEMVTSKSEITHIYLSEPSSADPNLPEYFPATDATDAAQWTAVIDNAGVGMKKIAVIGDFPEPETNVRTVSNSRKIIGKKKFVVNFTIDDVNDIIYRFSRDLDKGYQGFIWFANELYLYGAGAAPDTVHLHGIQVNITKANIDLQRGEDSYEQLLFTAEWENDSKPPRIANPF